MVQEQELQLTKVLNMVRQYNSIVSLTLAAVLPCDVSGIKVFLG